MLSDEMRDDWDDCGATARRGKKKGMGCVHEASRPSSEGFDEWRWGEQFWATAPSISEEERYLDKAEHGSPVRTSRVSALREEENIGHTLEFIRIWMLHDSTTAAQCARKGMPTLQSS